MTRQQILLTYIIGLIASVLFTWPLGLVVTFFFAQMCGEFKLK